MPLEAQTHQTPGGLETFRVITTRVVLKQDLNCTEQELTHGVEMVWRLGKGGAPTGVGIR